MSALVNLQGLRFGRLLVIRRDGSNHRRKAMWLCRCDCGNEHRVAGSYLTSGRTTSCGCFQREDLSKRRTKHGACKLRQRWPEYGAWLTMINRCHLPTAQKYRDYGARGISVCHRWRFGDGERSGFECFIADMGRRPDPSLSIDRIDNDSGYEPNNCRWATALQQANNRRAYRKRLDMEMDTGLLPREDAA